MTEHSKARSQIPHFNITTRGAAVDSAQRNPQFFGEEVNDFLGDMEVAPNSWGRSFNAFETSVLLMGLITGAQQHKISVRITIDREFWDQLDDTELLKKNGARVQEVFCLDPQAVTILYHPEHDEVSI